MSALRPDNDKTYEKLTRRFPLRPIRDDKQNDLAAEICNSLTDRLDELTPAERDYLEVLSDLIVKYESRWDDEIATMSPREVVEYLMEQNGLAQVDLVPEFGSRSRVCDFLNGKRRLSLEQARRLSERFKLEIRAEALNLSNTPHFSNPGSNVSNYVSPTNLGGFSQITSTNPLGRITDSRYFRFGLRVVF